MGFINAMVMDPALFATDTALSGQFTQLIPDAGLTPSTPSNTVQGGLAQAGAQPNALWAYGRSDDTPQPAINTDSQYQPEHIFLRSGMEDSIRGAN